MAQHLRSIATTGAHYWWHRHRYLLVAAAVPQDSASLLDFGCGSGTFVGWFKAREAEREVWGFDPEAAELPLPAGVRALPTWPAPAGRVFATIVTMDVLEHIADDVACLKQLAAALSEDGTLVLTVPAHQFFWSSWDLRLGHYRRYSPASLTAALEQAGLRVERCTHLFSFLVLPALVRRFTSAKASDSAAEFMPLPAAVNWLLRAVCAAERLLLRWANLPLGTSLFAVVRKGTKASESPDAGR